MKVGDLVRRVGFKEVMEIVQTYTLSDVVLCRFLFDRTRYDTHFERGKLIKVKETKEMYTKRLSLICDELARKNLNYEGLDYEVSFLENYVAIGCQDIPLTSIEEIVRKYESLYDRPKL